MASLTTIAATLWIALSAWSMKYSELYYSLAGRYQSHTAASQLYFMLSHHRAKDISLSGLKRNELAQRWFSARAKGARVEEAIILTEMIKRIRRYTTWSESASASPFYLEVLNEEIGKWTWAPLVCGGIFFSLALLFSILAVVSRIRSVRSRARPAFFGLAVPIIIEAAVFYGFALLPPNYQDGLVRASLTVSRIAIAAFVTVGAVALFIRLRTKSDERNKKEWKGLISRLVQRASWPRGSWVPIVFLVAWLVIAAHAGDLPFGINLGNVVTFASLAIVGIGAVLGSIWQFVAIHVQVRRLDEGGG